MSSEDGWFAGAMGDRDMAALSFGDFLRHASRGDLPRQYNLAQAPMYSQEPGLDAPLTGLLKDIRMPSALSPDNSDVLQSVNFWMAASKGSRSSLHYDPQHNLLCMVCGTKHVILFPPAASPHLTSTPLWSESANHSPLDFRDPLVRQEGSNPRIWEQRMQFTLQAGDVLFIPEGYWHQVDSSADTIAVNFWFESDATRRVLDPDVSHFYLTRLLQSAVALQKETLLRKIQLAPLGSEASSESQLQEGRDKLVRYMETTLGCEPDAKAQQHAQTLNSKEIALASALVGDPSVCPSKEHGCAGVFQAASADSLRKILLFLAHCNPPSIAKLLWGLDAPATALLIQRFEEMDASSTSEGSSDFYRDLYQCVEDVEGLEQRMVAMQEAFAEQAAAAVLSERLRVVDTDR